MPIGSVAQKLSSAKVSTFTVSINQYNLIAVLSSFDLVCHMIVYYIGKHA